MGKQRGGGELTELGLEMQRPHFRKPGIPYIAASRTLLKGRELSNGPTMEFLS